MHPLNGEKHIILALEMAKKIFWARHEFWVVHPCPRVSNFIIIAHLKFLYSLIYLEDNRDEISIGLEGDAEDDGEGRDGQDVIDARGRNDEGRDSLCNAVTFFLEGKQTGNNDRCKSKLKKVWKTRICKPY